MSSAPLGDRHTLAWSIEDAKFELQVAGTNASLCLPDGQIIEMSRPEWAALARAIGMVVIEPPLAVEPTGKKGSTKPRALKSGIDGLKRKTLIFCIAGRTVKRSAN